MKLIVVILGTLVLFSMLSMVSAGSISVPSFDKNVIVQTEVDAYFPCKIHKTNQIKCKKIKPHKLTQLKARLNPADRIRLEMFGIPMTNKRGQPIGNRNLNFSKDNTIDVNLSETGEFRVGFNSNLFIVTSLTNGLFNNTYEAGGNIYNEEDDGTWLSDTLDLNTSSAIIGLNWSEFEDPGARLDMRVRTYNISTETTGLAQGLRAYYKMDGKSYEDYSGFNRTGSPTGTVDILDSWQGRQGVLSLQSPNSYLTIAESDNHSDLCVNGCSMGGWFYNLGGSDALYFGRADAIDSDRFFYMMELYNRMYFGMFAGGTAQGCLARRASGGNFFVNRWGHLMGVYDDTLNKLTIYIDGALSAQVDCDIVIDTGEWGSDEDTTIGKFSLGWQPTFNGYIDEFAMWNRSLSASEISQIYNDNVKNWSYSNTVQSSPGSLTVDDGRYAQVQAIFDADNTNLNAILYNFSLEYDAVGTAPSNNPPTTTLLTPNNTVSLGNQTLRCRSQDVESGLTNVTLYTNTTGTFHANQTTTISGSDVTTSFDLQNIGEGGYIWNCLTYDNNNTFDWGNSNFTFIVEGACSDTDCADGFTCGPNNECRTSCSAQTHCNATTFCSTSSTCDTQIANNQTCWDVCYGNADCDEACAGGFCQADEIPAVGFYCNDDETQCMNNEAPYNEGNIFCAAGNDFYQCIGGDDAWSSRVDCADEFTPGDQIGADYCGYYDIATCNGGDGGLGCVLGDVIDCGLHEFDTSTNSCGITLDFCSRNCGAIYDSSNCAFPNNLNDDCTCDIFIVADNPPLVDLFAPIEGTIDQTNIEFEFTVQDDNATTNCSLWFLTDSIGWHVNQTINGSLPFDIVHNFTEITLPDKENVTWNTECYDTVGNSSFDANNATFSIDTDYVAILMFEIRNASEFGDLLFSVDEFGLVNVTQNLFVTGNLTLEGSFISNSPVIIPELQVTDYIDVQSSGLDKVRITNPYNEHIRFAGSEGKGDILFSLLEPIIFSQTHPYIRIDDEIRAGDGLRIEELINCDTLDTNQYGDVVCGEDEGDSGADLQLCTQESANVSTACGGLATGLYADSGTWKAAQPARLTYDEDYGTYGQGNFVDVTLYINYTKPANATIQSIWEVKHGESPITENTTLPYHCFNRENFEFRIIQDHSESNTTGYCYNDTGWTAIISNDQLFTGGRIYEERMEWMLLEQNVPEERVIFSTPCPAGNHLYINNNTNRLACEPDANSAASNIFDQDLNTTSNVTFHNITASGTIVTAVFEDLASGLKTGVTSNYVDTRNFKPRVNNSYDLGAPATRLYRNLYLGTGIIGQPLWQGVLEVNGSIELNNNASITIASSNTNIIIDENGNVEITLAD